jgi:transcriptional regulator of acetoin/glycerol metabolism
MPEFHAAGDCHGLADHVARVLGREERDDVGYVLAGCGAAERDGVDDALPRLFDCASLDEREELVFLVAEIGLGPPRLSSGAWNRLRGYPWPGNIRELHSVLARAMLDCGDTLITGNRLSLAVVSPRSSDTIKRTEDSLESQMIVNALREHSGNLTRAAQSIGWSRQKLYRRMHDLAIHA